MYSQHHANDRPYARTHTLIRSHPTRTTTYQTRCLRANARKHARTLSLSPSLRRKTHAHTHTAETYTNPPTHTQVTLAEAQEIVTRGGHVDALAAYADLLSRGEVAVEGGVLVSKTAGEKGALR